MFWYNTLPVQLKPNDQSSVFEIPSVQKNALTNGLGAHICLLVKRLQGISAVEKIQSFQDVLKRLWSPHSCISMSLFSSKWNVSFLL